MDPNSIGSCRKVVRDVVIRYLSRRFFLFALTFVRRAFVVVCRVILFQASLPGFYPSSHSVELVISRFSRTRQANPRISARFKSQLATASNAPQKCPVCGSFKIKPRGHDDGDKSYRCENGHVSLVKKRRARSWGSISTSRMTSEPSIVGHWTSALSPIFAD